MGFTGWSMHRERSVKWAVNIYLLFTLTSNHSSFPLVVAYCRILYHDIFPQIE